MNRKKITTFPLKELHALLSAGEITAEEVAKVAASSAAEYPGCPMYLWRPPATGASPAADSAPAPGPLEGLPLSVKDLFDVAGAPTTCGSSFFAGTRPIPTRDSGYVKRWKATGARVTGKTHLNEFAYGITGENRTFGDCWIPGYPDRLTGGSSSGAAASVAAGAACLALGTDTGGSLRVPAALCGLVSVRQSLGFGEMEGAFPLAQAFDTVGWIQRHLPDVAWVAHAVHPEIQPENVGAAPRIAWLDGPFLDGLGPEVAAARTEFREAVRTAGARVAERSAPGWEEAVGIFVPIQAHEASQNHSAFLPVHREQYDPAILERLTLGAAVTPDRLGELRRTRERFCRECIEPLWTDNEFLVVPASPVPRLEFGADHRNTRPRLLRLTAPASLGGLPVLTVPWCPDGVPGCGFQILARHGHDARLWALATWLASRM